MSWNEQPSSFSRVLPLKLLLLNKRRTARVVAIVTIVNALIFFVVPVVFLRFMKATLLFDILRTLSWFGVPFLEILLAVIFRFVSKSKDISKGFLIAGLLPLILIGMWVIYFFFASSIY